MVTLLNWNKKNTNSMFPHPFEYLYSARPCIQGSHPETNHPYQFKPRTTQQPKLLNSSSASINNNYSPLGMPKKSSLFNSTNVTPGDQLNKQFEIRYGIWRNGDHCFLRREDWSRWISVATHLFHWLKTIVHCGSFLVIFLPFFGSYTFGAV